MSFLIAPRHAAALAVALLLAMSPPAPSAWAQSSSDGGSSFSLDRIELSLYGGWFGGVTYLDLPPIAPEANDLGARDILDFSGVTLGRPKYAGQIDAAQKVVEDGWFGGFGAAFFLSPTFAIELVGAYGVSNSTVTGQYIDQDDLPEEDPTPGRFTWDETNMNWIIGGANMLYVFSPTRTVRPFVQIGLGGILNQFPNTDDVGALYFSYGAGVRYRLSQGVDAKLQIQSALFTWSQDEVDRNETVQYPSLSIGLIWKYDVPEESAEVPATETDPATQDAAPISSDTDSGL